MTRLSLRERFPLFLAIAFPALAALGVGRLLGNVGEIFGPHLRDAAWPAVTRLAVWLTIGLPARSVGATMAIVIASLGFLIVHRLAPERAGSRVLLLATLAWLLLVAALMLTLIGFAVPSARL